MSYKQLVPNADKKDIMFVFLEPKALLVYNGHAVNITITKEDLVPCLV